MLICTFLYSRADGRPSRLALGNKRDLDFGPLWGFARGGARGEAPLASSSQFVSVQGLHLIACHCRTGHGGFMRGYHLVFFLLSMVNRMDMDKSKHNHIKFTKEWRFFFKSKAVGGERKITSGLFRKYTWYFLKDYILHHNVDQLYTVTIKHVVLQYSNYIVTRYVSWQNVTYKEIMMTSLSIIPIWYWGQT